jgi:hypothetical protein
MALQGSVPSRRIEGVFMTSVPSVDPDLFRAVVERSVTGTSMGLEEKALASAREHLAKLSGGRATEAQVRLAATAYSLSSSERVFHALIARFEAFMELTSDPERQAVWATKGWVRLSSDAAGAIAPAKFLLAIAATCPLKAGAGTFQIAEFEKRATAVAPRL